MVEMRHKTQRCVRLMLMRVWVLLQVPCLFLLPGPALKDTL